MNAFVHYDHYRVKCENFNWLLHKLTGRNYADYTKSEIENLIAEASLLA